jgi:hypothetical protein
MAMTVMSALAIQVQTVEVALVPFSSAITNQAPAPWRVVGVPSGKIPLTNFSMADIDGRKVLRVATSKSYANLVHDMPLGATAEGLRLKWRWRLDDALQGADLHTRQGDDSPLKVCVLFDMPLEKLGLIERNLFRMARSASSEKLPSATLCYVWDDKLNPATLLLNAYTSRVRMIVVTSGHQHLGQWIVQSRNLAADFRQSFGAESDTLPPMLAILVGGDADNTGGHSLGYVDDIRLEP